MGRSLLVLITIILTFQLAESQNYADKPFDPRSSFGIFGDVSLNYHSADFIGLPGIPSCCPRYETGLGLGYGGGLFYTFPVSQKFELSLRAGYFNIGGKLSKTEPVRLAGPDGFGLDGEFEHSVDAKLSSAALMPLLGYRLGDQLRIHGGLRIGYVLDKSYQQKEEIISPDFGVFQDNGQRTRFEFSGDIPEYSQIEAALIAGISYDIPLNSSYTLFISPEAYLSYGLTKVSSESWTANALSGGLALRYAPRQIIPPKPPPPPPPPPPLPPPPPPPAVPILDASIYAVGLDDRSNETDVPILKVEEFLSNRMHPILNYVFFDENSSAIPQRYLRMSDAERQNFSVKQLYNLKTMDVYYQILNIVGKRMDFYPQAKLTLVGCNSDESVEKGNTDLSRKRAESVKNYLVDVWKIAADRIEIQARNLPVIPSNKTTQDGIEENRRVEMIANIPQVFEPMIIRDTVREANPPNIRFKTKINSEIGVNKWNIITSQNDKNLRVFSGGGIPPTNIDWDLRREEEQKFVPRFTEPLNYKLQVADNDNKIWESQVQTLPVEQLTVEKKMMEMIEDKEIDRFSLILFAFDQSNLSKENESIANFAKNRIKKRSTVTITGYTDRVGEPDHNLRLSERRAEATAKALGVDPSFAKGVGEGVLLYNNDLPEGRFYCRTVNIEIVTPIE